MEIFGKILWAMDLLFFFDQEGKHYVALTPVNILP